MFSEDDASQPVMNRSPLPFAEVPGGPRNQVTPARHPRNRNGRLLDDRNLLATTSVQMKMTSAFLSLVLLVAPASTAQDFAQPPSESVSGSVFLCEDGQSLNMRLGTRNKEAVAAVSTDGVRHVLALQPWDGVTPQIVWTDGLHTLTWNAGVRLMWMDGAGHLVCGRGGRRLTTRLAE